MSDLTDIVTVLGFIAPEFTGEAAARLNYFGQSCIDETDKDVFPSSYIDAMAYLTAHKLTRAMAVSGSAVGAGAGSGAGGYVGSISSVKVGDESINYGGAGGFSANSVVGVGEGDAELGTTRYGMAFMRLRNKQPDIGMFLA